MATKPVKKTAPLPSTKKPSEKTQREMVSRRSKLTDIVDSALTDKTEEAAPKEVETKVESSTASTASLPPAAKRPGTTKSTTTTTPAKGGKLELDELLTDLGKPKKPVQGPSVDFTKYYK